MFCIPQYFFTVTNGQFLSRTLQTWGNQPNWFFSNTMMKVVSYLKIHELVSWKYIRLIIVTIQKPEGASWLKFNYDQIGYYRVNYPVEVWNNLSSIYDSLNVSDRTHLIEESFSLAEASLLSYEVPLELTKNIVNEIEYTPWSVASSKLQSILSYLTGSESAQAETVKVSNK